MLAIFDRLLFALSVPKCISCGEKLSYGELSLCRSCISGLREAKSRNCSICANKLTECGCSNSFLSNHYVKRVAKVFRYFAHDRSRPENLLIYSLKQDNRADTVKLSADLLSQAISNVIPDPEECIFTNIPRRRSAILEFGYDHAGVLARELAKRFDAKYISILTSKSKKAQKSLMGSDRFKNAEFDYRCRPDLAGKRVIIVDDVITTGASLSRAAMLMRGLGAKRISAAALAIAYKDDYTSFA